MMFALKAISILCCLPVIAFSSKTLPTRSIANDTNAATPPVAQPLLAVRDLNAWHSLNDESGLCPDAFFAFCPQSRIEDHTDSKIAAKENSKKNHKPSKPTVWNLDGGVFFATDGHLPNGSCFRLSGHMTAPNFFDDLRRIDTDDGTTYKLHNKPVSTYPSELLLTVHLLDFPCAVDLKDTEIRPPLTPELMSTLRLNFFWKDGVAMRPVVGSKRTNASARRLVPYSIDAASELAPRFEFNYLFTVESDSVPLTNDLVLIIENEDHKIAARTAARL